jgi:SAM-dependent methyltransferase
VKELNEKEKAIAAGAALIALGNQITKAAVMKNRTDLLNHLAEKYKLERYLEIGVQVPELNFDRIKCKYKVGVDPDSDIFSDTGDIYPATSDFFFAEISEDLGFRDKKFDLIFIDGLHIAEQVKKDFENALKILSPNGFIVLHDCNPEKEEHTIVPRPTERGHWNGDVYRFALALAKEDALDVDTVDIDNGCMVISRAAGTQVYIVPEPTYKPWNEFDKNRKELLNLISWDEFIGIGSHF